MGFRKIEGSEGRDGKEYPGWTAVNERGVRIWKGVPPWVIYYRDGERKRGFGFACDPIFKKEHPSGKHTSQVDWSGSTAAKPESGLAEEDAERIRKEIEEALYVLGAENVTFV